MHRTLPELLAALVASLLVTACGGGGSYSSATGGEPPGALTNQQRSQAAAATAQGNALCTAVRPFYWEIGDRTGALASGSVASGTGGPSYSATSVLSIASASKWLYGIYVLERRGGMLTPDDYKYLNFQSGYTSFDQCLRDQTIAECEAYENNDVYTAATDGKFFYNGGHMERHAALLGLGPMDNALLAAELQSKLGADVALAYSQPQLAGGVYMTPSAYAIVLRRVLSGQYRMASALGTHSVCTNPRTCAAAVFTPIPLAESWHYSVGHWVEDDPAVGDGAFSSPGAFGFYPWIDATRTWYGIVARAAQAGALDSVDCGRVVRKAWITGQAQ